MDAAVLLRELIALPSVNPAFLPAGHPWAGEQRVCDFLAATAARLGLDLDFQDVESGRRNLLARLCPVGRPRHRVILAPHLDTVGGSDIHFTPRAARSRLYGRGACDTKGSIAAMLTALSRVAGSARRPAATEIVFAGLIDEEHGQIGSRFLARSGVKADLAIVGEPTRLEVVTAHKGDVWLRLETRGKAAHGAHPGLGVNAVHDMARIVRLLETKYSSGLRRHAHPLLGRGTINVGVIAGGTQPNIVPDRCGIQIDRRTLPGENETTVIGQVRSLLRQNRLQARVTSLKEATCPPLETSPRLPFVSRFLEAARQTRPAGVAFFCDAAVLAAAGIPSVVFGPGDIAQAHTEDEWISLRSLERATNLLTRFLASLP